MLNKTKTVIGINPGSRYLGFAVFKDSEPMDWGVKIVCGKGTKQKSVAIETLITKLTDRYAPDIVALKKINPVRSSARLNKITEAIKSVLKIKGVATPEYSVKDVAKFLSPDKRLNKRKVAELIASKYPALSPEFNQEQNNLNPYHIRMFEAVALAETYFKQLQTNHNPKC